MAVKPAILPLGGLLAGVRKRAGTGTTASRRTGSEPACRRSNGSAWGVGRSRGGQLFPLVNGLEDLPQPRNELRLAVVKLPAPARIKLDEMGTTPMGQIAPAL